MTVHDIDNELNNILKKTRPPSAYIPLPEEVARLTSAFLSTAADTSAIRSKAYVVLSAVVQGLLDGQGKGKSREDATEIVVNLFSPTVLKYLGETAETPLLHGITFLTALFQVDLQSASVIFAKDGVVENLMDTIDLSPSPLLCQEVAHLLGQACGHKTCRAIVTPQIVRWLEFSSQQTADAVLQSAASVALVKLSKGSASDAPENGTPEVHGVQVTQLAERLIPIITAGKVASPVDAIEGLAYLSAESAIKETLSRDPAFLKRLFALVPQQKKSTSTGSIDVNATLIYGIVLIICNLTSFRPKLTQEQQQLEKLKKMAKAGKGLEQTDDTTSVLDDDEHVKSRIRLLIESGVLHVFPAAVATADSLGVKNCVGKSILHIVEEKENRGQVIQAGGAKILQGIIKQTLSSPAEGTKSKQANFSSADLETVQALAKLAITAAPVQVFGPNVGIMYDAIRPFSILLQHSSSNLLQRFEAIMALTNLASHGPETAEKIANAEGLVDKVELLLLEEHVLVRRASVELICNLIGGSDVVFERYSGGNPNSASKIHVLLALSDVDDLPTRLASSGALATVTASPSACSALISLQFEKHRFLELMTQLIDPSCLPDHWAETEDGGQPLESNEGLVHRGVVCVANVFQSIVTPDVREKIIKEATESGLLRSLLQMVKGDGITKTPPIVNQAALALKAIMGK